MRTYDKFYINGQWVEPIGKGTSDVINPATGEISARVPYGNADDVDAAVTAAKNAFPSWSQTSAAERAEFLRKIAAEGEKRNADLTQTIIDELGMPIQNAAEFQVDPLTIICESFAEKAKLMEQSKEVGNSIIVKEPIGVCAMINPWNYPIWQMMDHRCHPGPAGNLRLGGGRRRPMPPGCGHDRSGAHRSRSLHPGRGCGVDRRRPFHRESWRRCGADRLRVRAEDCLRRR